MAKDFSQSRIPRLDGGGRIAAQVVTQKCHLLNSNQFFKKRPSPSSLSALRSQMPSIKKTLSSEKICETTAHLNKKPKTIIQKYVIKSEQMQFDNALINNSNIENITMEKIKKDDANLKLVEPNLTGICGGTLTRSDTFVRDKFTDLNSLFNVTHDVTTTNVINNVQKMSNNTLYTTKLIDQKSNLGDFKQNNLITKYGSIADRDNGFIDNCFDVTLTGEVNDSNVNSISTIYLGDMDASVTTDIQSTYVKSVDEKNMKLILNSTMNNDCLLDITSTIPSTKNFFNITKDFDELEQNQKVNDNLLSVTHEIMDNTILAPNCETFQDTEDNMFTEDEVLSNIIMDENEMLNPIQIQEPKAFNKPRFSLGLDLTDCTLDCSIELCDVSLASTGPIQANSPLLKKQNSFEMDESLGILTPDQMKEFLDSTTTTTNLDLPINIQPNGKLALHQMRIDQTPSPEDLPLDTVEVKTDLNDTVIVQDLNHPVLQGVIAYQELSQTDSDCKTDQLTKSNTSKVSNSFITSITSITSLDTGYQGDGEMSRPASRGAGDHSPSNGPRKPHPGRMPSNQNQQANIPIRRQDPMTDSDFFTESDADDILNRGDRRAQVIDGQLYGPTLQPSSVFITEQPQMDDSCMESSGIFTDVENRCEDEMAQNRVEVDIDMSPDGSTDTIKSNNAEYRHHEKDRSTSPPDQGQLTILTGNETLLPIQSSVSSERVTLNYSSNSSNSSSLIAGDASLQSNDHTLRSNDAMSRHYEKVAAPLSIFTGGTCGTINTKASSTNYGGGSNVNEDKNTNEQNTSVKKSNSPRKQHFHGGIVKYEEKAIEIANKIVTIGDSIKPKTCINAFTKKSISISGDRGGDMLVKHNSLKNDSQENNKCLAKVNENNSSADVGGSSGGSGGVNVIGGTARKFPPNKWDAVMNKIAENKVHHKTNYNDVKSKVSSGASRRLISGFVKLPVKNNSEENSAGSVNSSNGKSTPISKHILQATKRGRSFSKDSQLSSQSDLSLSGGSPKERNAANNIRSAKKRDVRTLSISPTDLGPPSKSQTNVNNRTKQKAVLPQKRILQGTQHTTPSSFSGPKDKILPCAKKALSRSRLQAQIKVPLNDNNRHLNQTQKLQPNTKCSAKDEDISLSKNKKFSEHRIPSNTELKIDLSPLQSPSVVSNLSKTHNDNLLLQRQQDEVHKHRQDSVVANKALRVNLAYANKGIEAFGILIQYLAYDLDAFSCPNLKDKYNQIRKKLTENEQLLEKSTVLCQNLKDELCEKESQYSATEVEIIERHRCEIEKVEKLFNDFKISAKNEITALESELSRKDADYDRTFQEYILKTDQKIATLEEDVKLADIKRQELLKFVSKLSATEKELRETILITESTLENCSRSASEREEELSLKVNALTTELHLLRNRTDNRERELEEKLNLYHDEISVLRNCRNLLEYPTQGKNGNDSINGSAPNKIQMLQDEVESLRCVLELKQSEISELRKHNQELQETADNLPAMQMKISALESRVEDLQIQLKAKGDEEKELIQRNKYLQESYTQEVKNRNRLSLHNEELQWKLKQNSEKFALALNELSKSYQEQAGFFNLSKTSIHSQDNIELLSSYNSSLVSLNRSNGSDRIVGCFPMDDLSPPTSPLVKAVVEKNDSVSWVLEMDDETPEVLASRMIRRAGSFRSNINEKSPNLKRQYSRPASGNLGNPLTQSASATSVIKQHSEDSGSTPHDSNNQNSRIRSKSVTIKKSEHKSLLRQNSGGRVASSLKEAELSSWKEPICSSSPYNGNKKSPTKLSISKSIASSSNQGDILFRRNRANSFDTDTSSRMFRKQQGNLITCDALVLSQRLELRSMPSHPSVQDLKKLKKNQEIQESAGEAMVSETNSEDEGCSALDDSVSPTSSTSSLCGKSNLFAEDCMVMDKISTSFGGTPMEVSWSDDAEQFPSESIV